MKRPKTRTARRAPDPTTPTEQVAVSAWLRLLRVQALLEKEVRRELGADFTLPQFDVLNQLARRPDGMTFVDLSRQLLVTAGNLTGIVDRLERDRLVRRRPHPADRRAARLTLTPRGWKAVSEAVPVHHETIARMLALLPRRDLAQLRVLLGRLRDRLEHRLTVPARRK
ncbi:MAG: MarR family transcriptional regulator [Candidatus Rokubacteria bacterium]|nr:MarR family transcriptional regulator [Candidatus Rokubacteria bacterium]